MRKVDIYKTVTIDDHVIVVIAKLDNDKYMVIELDKDYGLVFESFEKLRGYLENKIEEFEEIERLFKLS